MDNTYIGVDLGGTHLRAAIVNTETGKLTGLKQIPTLAREGHDAVIARMAILIEDVIHEQQIDKTDIGGIGIGVPGVLDLERGIVLFLPNLAGTWPNVPLKKIIEEKVEIPTSLLNDARSMTFGEWKFGAGQGVDTIACFAIGTGIGGGLVINGKLHLGIGGTGGELGHQIIDFNGPPCGCGSHGCLEAFASGPAIAAMGVKAVLQGLTTSIGEIVDYDLNKITPKIIYQAAMEGDEIAHNIFEKAGFYIGIAVANIMVTIGPCKVVIGGGVAQAGDLLLEPIRRTAYERVFVMPREQVEIVPAALGPYAGLVGAALWAREQQSISTDGATN
ncbi:MAG: ROK family protein [Anaerolineales bacterium]|nr:ROK family protein [Anaerolineales bacterium]